MIRKILHAYELAEANGHFKNVNTTPLKATYATILEAGCLAFHKSYIGNKDWNAVANDVAANRKGYEEAAQLQESLLRDISRPMRTLREAHTTTDFPMILANVRNQVLREQINPVQSKLWDMSEKRIATDFKIMKSYRVSDAEELVLRPEGEDVEMSTISMSGDGYAVANYERAIPFTWEMWKNDDLGVFKLALKRLGLAARRLRSKVVFEAIAAKIDAVQVGGSAGGPDIDRIVALAQILAGRLDASGNAFDIGLTNIAYPAKWTPTANSALLSEYLLGPTATKGGSRNPAFGLAVGEEERAMARYLGGDWIGFDSNYPWLETAVLDDFQSGPLTYTQTPDTDEHPDQGSFSNHTLCVKVGDAVAATVTDTTPVVRVSGG